MDSFFFLDRGFTRSEATTDAKDARDARRTAKRDVRSGADARGFSRVQKVPEDVRLGREDARDARPSAIGMLDAPSGGCLDQRQQRESLGLFVWLLTRQEATTTGCQGCSRTMSDDAGEASAAAHTHTPTHTKDTHRTLFRRAPTVFFALFGDFFVFF